VSHVKIM